jgi:hypothetical protein
MTNLPGVSNATLDEAKITRYLLNPANPQGAGKAKFFKARGFTLAHWQVLKAALLAHAANNPVSAQEISIWGTKYEVTCAIATPDKTNPCIVSVWIIEHNDPRPRFVTAYAFP